MQKRPIAYVSGPYTAPTDEGIQSNIDAAVTVAQDLMQRGYAVICPHSMTAWWDKARPFSWQDFIDNDLRLVDASDCIVTLPGWEQSKGALVELDYATNAGKPWFRDTTSVPPVDEFPW